MDLNWTKTLLCDSPWPVIFARKISIKTNRVEAMVFEHLVLCSILGKNVQMFKKEPDMISVPSDIWKQILVAMTTSHIQNIDKKI